MQPDDDSLVGLLDQIGAFTEPAPVSMWPATWGWAVLGLIALAGLGFAVQAGLRHRAAGAYRRAALAELRALQPALERGEPDALARLDRLIRRTALAAFPRRDVAALTGSEWPAFLNRTGGRFDNVSALLVTAPYAPPGTCDDGPALAEAARHWIGHHHA